MSRVQETPNMTPSFCYGSALSDFLRLSRYAVDDTISQNLDALMTPGEKPFDSRSTATRQPRSGKRLDGKTCNDFKDKVLFPNWQARDDVMHYCTGIATSPDTRDPDDLLRQIEDEKARQRVVNERLDPYSARYFPLDTKSEALAGLLRNEKMVEDIVRRRTWQIVGERCDDHVQDFDTAIDEWRKRRR